LLRVFGARRQKPLMFRLGMTEGRAHPNPKLNLSSHRKRPAKRSKRKNFEARKHLLEYDDVMNKQRETIYPSAAPH